MTEEEQKIELAIKLDRLYKNKDFQELILERFINQGIVDLTLNENVDSKATRSSLKARQILYKYLYDIIQEAEVLKSELKE